MCSNSLTRILLLELPGAIVDKSGSFIVWMHGVKYWMGIKSCDLTHIGIQSGMIAASRV
jgi:hypothetical protein